MSRLRLALAVAAAFGAWELLFAGFMADDLMQLGVLQPGLKGHYFLAYQPGPNEVCPAAFFPKRPGPLTGLSREDFIAELHGPAGAENKPRDDLYSTVSWQVLDAVVDGRITLADLPPFLRQIYERL